ncbi:MAG: NAD(P)/FAD-dependent oxidoreductase [Deltaproteobacteria bacterium]|nr:NAD(P)/FAD-dependent oxidoreductase [Deltaproteobacteria bacterium]MBM4323928.1 NAD(P)/FAD-dependent oxidoreductase [Deltaproteobacteria bacterium]
MRYVIIGGSGAGISAIEAIRSIDRESPIDLFSDEATPLFSRVLLPYYIAEELSKPLLNFRSADFFDQNRITPHLGVRVHRISIESKTVQTKNGDAYPFDKLLLATGGNPIIPPIPGIEKEGISTLKTMADAEKIYNLKGRKAVVIGAGSVGVESCISLKRRGMEVTLLEQLAHVLPTVFDEEAASIIRKRIENLGIKTITGEKALRFTGNGKVKGVITDSREIECDMVVVAVGVKPAVELAQTAGIEIGSLGGIKVNSQMMTSVPDIYSAGDVTETYDITRDSNWINAIWPCAVEQGRIAGLNMVGRETPYEGSFRRNSIGNFIGVPAISMGLTQAETCSSCEAGETFQEIRRRTKDTYKKLILKNGRLAGAILVGQTQKAGLFFILLKKKVDVSDYTSVLMSRDLNFMNILPLIRRNADRFTETEYKEIMDTML